MGVLLESSTDCVCHGASRDKHEIQIAMNLTNGTWMPGKLWQHAVEAYGGWGGEGRSGRYEDKAEMQPGSKV